MGLIDSDLRVLIIDANAHIRRLIATLLGALAIKDVAEARNPTAAVPLMLSKAPDLIIADWTGDPTEILLFVHRIRRGELVDRRTPVLALSNSTHHAVLERASEAGIDDVIAKPLSAIDVIQRSASLIEGWRRVDYLAGASAAE
ncbi:MAG TPA: response regulator [Candidatus Omnitrophota bacterium]|nr:response regulator [Candidatus Omnitrophota bacterium]